MSMGQTRFGILLAVLSAFIASDYAFAQSPSVTAVLSNSEATVGQMVQMEIKVTGASRAHVPQEISVDGLEIHQTGQKYESSFSFGTGTNENSSSVIYDYTVLPEKPGTFKIPSQTIRAGSTSLTTPELTLHVAGSPGRQAAPNRGSGGSNVSPGKLVFAELIVPKKSAYVGEVIPAVVRLGFATRLVSLDGPQIAGQG